MPDKVDRKDAGRILILSGGSVGQAFLVETIKKYAFDTILCVDGGLRYAYENELIVNYIIGDFDTIEPEILKFYEDNTQAIIQRLKPEKDNTDTDVALELALSWKPEEIFVLGGIGTRLDHTLGNIHILKKTVYGDTRVYLIDEHNRISMLAKPTVIQKKEAFGDVVSLIPFTDKVENVTLKGFRYLLDHETMLAGESLGVSNVIEDATAEIAFDSGILLVIEARD